MAADHARTPAISRSTGARVAYARADFDMDIWQFQPNGAPSRSPLSSTLDDRDPQLSPDGTRLVFESRRLGKESQLWIGNADGTKVTQLTEGGRGIQGAPSWSPDGNWIAFDGTVSANRSGIWIVEATGGQPRLLSAPGIIPSWSRDGKWIYFTRGGPVWRIPAQGGDAQQVTENNGSNAVESPDGGTLYYSRGNAIFAKPSGGGRESHVMDMAGSALGGSSVHRWLPVDGGICYLTRPDWKMPFQFELRFMDLRSHRETPPYAKTVEQRGGSVIAKRAHSSRPRGVPALRAVDEVQWFSVADRLSSAAARHVVNGAAMNVAPAPVVA